MIKENNLSNILTIEDYLNYDFKGTRNVVLEEKIILNCIKNELNEELKLVLEDYDEYDDLDEIADTKDKKTEEFGKKKGQQIVNYINKCLHWKKEELATEPFPRKVLRVALQLLLIFGPLIIPINPIKKLICSLTGIMIANKVSIQSKRNLINLYKVKLEQVERKIENSDDDKEIYELKKIQMTMKKEMGKLTKSLNPAEYAAQSNSNGGY